MTNNNEDLTDFTIYNINPRKILHGNPKIYQKNTKDLYYKTTLSSSLLKPVLTDLYAESKEKVYNDNEKQNTDKYILEWLTLSPLHSWSQYESDLYTESKEREIDNKYYEKYLGFI